MKKANPAMLRNCESQTTARFRFQLTIGEEPGADGESGRFLRRVVRHLDLVDDGADQVHAAVHEDDLASDGRSLGQEEAGLGDLLGR